MPKYGETVFAPLIIWPTKVDRAFYGDAWAYAKGDARKKRWLAGHCDYQPFRIYKKFYTLWFYDHPSYKEFE